MYKYIHISRVTLNWRWWQLFENGVLSILRADDGAATATTTICDGAIDL